MGGTMVQDWRDVMVMFGLGQPAARAFVAGVSVATLAYTASFPAEAFREDGSLAPSSVLSPGPDSVGSKHFLVIPAVVAGAVYLFT